MAKCKNCKKEYSSFRAFICPCGCEFCESCGKQKEYLSSYWHCPKCGQLTSNTKKVW